jgi:uncharacterized protein YndB with AHSA1/START domain
MIKKIAIGLGVLVALLAAVIAMQPSTFAIERSTEIAAPADVVYAHIESLRAMDAWSPWVAMDPKLAITHDGPESGVGAGESWEGPEMGAGRMTITSVKPNEEVELKLEFMKPMEATHRALFTLMPAGDGTLVNWRMEGTNNFMGKAASLVMNMDQRVGGTFEKGLASLKTLAETDAKEREAIAAAAAAQTAAPTMTFEDMKSALGEPPGDPDLPATPPSDE